MTDQTRLPKAPADKDKDSRRRWQVLGAGGIALAVGVAVCLLTPLVGGVAPKWFVSAMLVGFMLAAVAVAAVIGFIFGVPRAKAEPAPDPNAASGNKKERVAKYEANSNLEQVSDWLTKILLGAGLVQLAVLPSALRKVGEYLGPALGFPGSAQTSVAIVLYGAGVGFLFTYLWARLHFRILLEASEVLADEESRRRDIYESEIQIAEVQSEEPRSPGEIKRSLNEVDDLVREAAASAPVLWVDDHPENNVNVAAALRAAGITVVLARTTREAMERLSRQNFGLIITDLGRWEGGEQKVLYAGRDLIEQVVAEYPERRPPIIVYAAQRGLDNRDELMSAGAAFVTASPSELFSKAIELLAKPPVRSSPARN